MVHTALFIAAAVLMSPGLVMPLVPMLPALPYMLVVALLFGLYDGFDALSGGEFAWLAGIAALSVIVDQLAGLLGAKYSGAHAKSLLAGIAGSLVGAFAFPPLGAVLGLFVSVFVAEIVFMKGKREALKAASGAVLGAVGGIMANLALAAAFLLLFVFFVLR